MALTAQPHLPKFPTQLIPRAVSPHHHAEKRCEKRCQRLAINPDPLDTDPDDCEFDHAHCLRSVAAFCRTGCTGLEIPAKHRACAIQNAAAKAPFSANRRSFSAGSLMAGSRNGSETFAENPVCPATTRSATLKQQLSRSQGLGSSR